MSGKAVLPSDSLDVALSILMNLFCHRNIQFNPALASKTISNLVVLSTYLKIVAKIGAYTTAMGFIQQLIELHEKKICLDPTSTFS
jgi:hypothetical protein